ncbi:DNA ligase [Dehalococcoides mccartyi]|uniref:DNA ligase n=1 Tax=Dehalococcoides mccartyi TaxID=61435 RepID=A0AB38Z8Z3_9CHLR|nr:DNA ligase [Dehalococcoides mccartyi]WRO07068.1 DNA ligase [Dehalococcoides mccartyi]
MSKMSELDLCIGELRNAAQSLTAVADSLSTLFDNSDNTEPEAKAPPSETKAKPVTLEQVRAVLAEKSRSGHTADVRDLLQKHGASKLSEIDPTKFEVLLEEASAIGLGEGEDE